MAEEKLETIQRPETHVHDQQWRQLNKYKMKKFKGAKAALPTGALIDATRFANVRPPGTRNSYVISNIHEFLHKPKPGFRYIWRERSSDETIGMVESHTIRPVKMDEVMRVRETIGLHGFAGVDGIKYVGWKRLALFEVPPDIAYEWYQHPVDWAISKTVQRPEEFEDQVERYTHGRMEGKFTQRDRASAAEEANRR